MACRNYPPPPLPPLLTERLLRAFHSPILPTFLICLYYMLFFLFGSSQWLEIHFHNILLKMCEPHFCKPSPHKQLFRLFCCFIQVIEWLNWTVFISLGENSLMAAQRKKQVTIIQLHLNLLKFKVKDKNPQLEQP